MSAYQIDFDGQGHRVFLTSNGIDKQYLGPRFATPRQAIAYSHLLEGTDRISPLRASGPAQDEDGLGAVSGSPGRIEQLDLFVPPDE